MSDPNEQTLFLIGEPSDFAPLHLSRRTVVLTPEDFAAYEDKFGPTLALDMTNMIVRHDGLVARVKLTWPLASRTYEVLKTVDGWRTFLVSSSAF